MLTSRSILAPFLFVTVGCGGKVVFDQGSGGSGGTSTIGPSTSSKATSVTVASSSSTGTPLQGCLAYGFQGIGGFCNDEGVSCLIEHSCCNEIQAKCTKGIWTVSGGQQCKKVCEPQCGAGLTCEGICVINQTDVAETFLCAEDPCPNQPLDCTCGAKACTPSFLTCASIMPPSTLVCDCPNC